MASARPYWNPYVVGALLGLLLLGTYALTGRGLGATGAFNALVTWVVGMLSPEHVEANPVYVRYFDDGTPLLSFLPFLVLGAFIGAAVSGMLAGRTRVAVEKGPRVSVAWRLLLAFVGGAVAAIGAKIALGCTSGQALSGGALLDVGSLLFMLSVFVSGYAAAFVLRKEWI